MAHAVFVLDEIGFGMGGEINRLAFAHAIVRDRAFAPLLGPMTESFLVNMGAPELDERAILKNSPAIIADRPAGAEAGCSKSSSLVKPSALAVSIKIKI